MAELNEHLLKVINVDTEEYIRNIMEGLICKYMHKLNFLFFLKKKKQLYVNKKVSQLFFVQLPVESTKQVQFVLFLVVCIF